MPHGVTLNMETIFKPGDKVRRTGCDVNEVKQGKVYTVKACNPLKGLYLKEIDPSYGYSINQFELVKPAKQLPEWF